MTTTTTKSKLHITDKAKLEKLAINTIRFLSVDAVQRANSGHPGLPLGAAPMAYALWTGFLKHNPVNPKWFDRDRFVLSAGHGSMLLYSLLHLTGYDVTMEQIKQFRQLGSITPGHPERTLVPGVEVTTGPLGQGFGNGVGLAMAEAHLAERYNRSGFEVINHYTYGILSDGDIMEGVSSEAASLAGHLKLGKLIFLYDNNHVTLSASTELTLSEAVDKRFEAYGWHVQRVEDGNDVEAISQAIEKARQATGYPSLIMARTHIGYGSPNKQDTFSAHGSPLGEKEVNLTKENLGWPAEPLFYVPEEVGEFFRQAIVTGCDQENEWNKKYLDYKKHYPKESSELMRMMEDEREPGWDESISRFEPDDKGTSTRKASGKIMQEVYKKVPALIGGSGDLNPSTYSALEGAGDFQHPSKAGGDMQGSTGDNWNYAGRNIYFGVREHAMAAILNGMAAHGGLVPYGATFLSFSDYMRPSIRLAALSKLHVIYIFTHDSIGLGEDGPTHQPVEQIISLRAIPDLMVIRPGDGNETVEAWKVALEIRDKPVALILTRQDLPILDRCQYASEDGLRRGGYILSDAPGALPEVILIASGSEVSLITDAQKKLFEKNIPTRIVSMPSWELFDDQPIGYREAVLPPSVLNKLAVEAGSTLGWCRYVGEHGDVLGIDRFGTSAPGPTALREYGFTVDNIVDKAMELIEKNSHK